MNSWFVYHIPPVDIGWEHLKTVKKTIEIIVENTRAEERLNYKDLQRFVEDWRQAQQLARTVGWEGDAELDAVIWLPGDVEFEYGFVFKQDNNGSTFVVSPVPLPSLDNLKFNK